MSNEISKYYSTFLKIEKDDKTGRPKDRRPLQVPKSNFGITLIALIITIIVLLILAGVTLNMLMGENGIFGKAKWSKFVTEYRAVEEAEHLYELNNNLEQKEESNKYAITNEEVEPEGTLLKTIQYVEKNIEIKLYKIDKEKINISDVKDDYVININSGKIYKVKGEKYKGNTYHLPEYGINSNGEAEEGEKIDTKTTIYLNINETKHINDEWRDISGDDLEWKTSDDTVVTVDNDGNITGVAKGEATVILRHKIIANDNITEDGNEAENSEKQEFKIIVADGIPKEFTITMENKEIYEYETATMEVKIDGISIGTNYIEFSSSDNNIVEINARGEIVGTGVGNAEITAVWKSDKTKTASAKITVKQNNNLAINKTKLNMAITQIVQLNAKYNESNVTKTAKWESENEDIATVINGKVTAKSLGTTKIKVTSNNQTKYCDIEVKDLVSEIYTIEDLSLLQTQVAAGINFQDKTVKLINNLDFKNNVNYESTESEEYKKYYTNYNSGIYTVDSSWIAIGASTSKYFKGTFDGQGKTIKNLYINATTAYQGLFGYSNGGTFKNMNFENTNIISTKGNVGTVIGYGNNVTITNCNNNGTLETTAYNIGGIAGAVYNLSIIRNCTNRGTVTGTGYYSTTYYYGDVGGVFGVVSSAGEINIENCTNYSEVNGKYNYVAGISGRYFSKDGKISNCLNEGNITSNKQYTGGISGNLGINLNNGNLRRNGTISDSVNKGNITSTGIYTGGITGTVSCSSIMQNTQNYGNVSNTGKDDGNRACCGGITGNMNPIGTNIIKNSNNYGEVNVDYCYTGGIVGWAQKGEILNCTNEKKVTGKRSGVGGIAGQIGRSDSSYKVNAEIKNCINKGDVEITGTGVTSSSAGGISGAITQSSSISYCGNIGNIKTNGYNLSNDKSGRVGRNSWSNGISRYKFGNILL